VRVPSVIRLLEYRRIPHQSRALSRKNILLRDRKPVSIAASAAFRRLTLDHVIRALAEAFPLGKTSSLLHPCNRAKATSFRNEVNMSRRVEPRSFNLHTSRHIMRLMGTPTTSGGSTSFTENREMQFEEIRIRACLRHAKAKYGNGFNRASVAGPQRLKPLAFPLRHR